MAKQLRLQSSESVVVHAASRIYAAYISNGQVTEGQQADFMKRSIREAIQIALAVDDAVVSDDEVDSISF